MNPQWLKLLFEDHLNISASESHEILHGVFNGEIDPHELAIMLVANKITGQTEPEFAANIKQWLSQQNYNASFQDVKHPIVEVTVFEHNNKTINITLTASLVAAYLGAYIFIRDYTVNQHSYIGQQLHKGFLENHLTESSVFNYALSSLNQFKFGYIHSNFLHERHNRREKSVLTKSHKKVYKQKIVNHASKHQNYIEGIFSILDNPLRANVYFICIDNPNLIKPIAECFATFSIERAFIVYSPGVSGFSLHAATKITEINQKKVVQHNLTPSSVNLSVKPWSAIICNKPQNIVLTEKAVLNGSADLTFKQIVAANAGLLLVAAKVFKTLPQATRAALDVINNGEPELFLRKLVGAYD